MTTTTYDFKKVSVIVDDFIITGYMVGESISVEKNEDDTTPHVGAAGDVTFAESNDETATLTLTLKLTSSSLPVLNALRRSKRIFPVRIVDSNTNAVRCGGTEARILRAPNRSWGNEVTGVEVPIYIADYKETN